MDVKISAFIEFPSGRTPMKPDFASTRTRSEDRTRRRRGIDLKNPFTMSKKCGANRRVAAQCCAEPITLTGAGSVSKSYPDFWEDYKSVGGKIEVLA